MLRSRSRALPGDDGLALPVVVLWCVGSSRELAHDLIRSQGLQNLGLSDDAVRVLNHCGACGSSTHGRPVLAPIPGVVAPHVSISYAKDLTVVALTSAGPVGVDVEHNDAASFPGFDAATAHEREVLTSARARTITWVRKESLLKAAGRGLTLDPRAIRLTRPNEAPALVAWSATDPPDSPVWMRDIELTSAHVAAVTVISEVRPDLDVKRADPVARSYQARA